MKRQLRISWWWREWRRNWWRWWKGRTLVSLSTAKKKTEENERRNQPSKTMTWSKSNFQVRLSQRASNSSALTIAIAKKSSNQGKNLLLLLISDYAIHILLLLFLRELRSLSNTQKKRNKTSERLVIRKHRLPPTFPEAENVLWGSK